MSAWLSDPDYEGSSTLQPQRVGEGLLTLSDCGDDRPSVGSSPRIGRDSSSPEEQPQQRKPQIQLPKVDYTRGSLISSPMTGYGQ